jgi:predicted ATPase
MEYLAEILKLGSKGTQILITTHSPYLLDYLPPESLVIVTKERGETRAKRVRRDRALKEALEVLGLGEMWRSGHLGGTP